MELKRDLTLDVAKGLAIMLVIVGHICQGWQENFDDLWLFRIIYSFHMPFFMMLSGMVAALRPPAAEKSGHAVAQAIGHSAIRLLVPMFVWAVISWATNWKTNPPLAEWLGRMVYEPDYGLWFLLAVFYCASLWQLCHLLASVLKKRLPAGSCLALVTKDYVFLPVSIVLVQYCVPRIGVHYGKSYLILYYHYFCAGALFQNHARGWLRNEHWKKGGRIIALLLFVDLVPFWVRNSHCGGPALWLSHYFNASLVDVAFRFIVAVSISLLIFDLAGYVAHSRFMRIKNFVSYCGVASLGIYAAHFHLVGYRPLFLTPLLGSLAFYWVMSRMPVARTLLFGERKGPRWPVFRKT